MGTTYLTPTEVTPGSAGAWTDVDVSASVPAGATGVLLHVVNNGGVATAVGLRKNGSTDNDTNSVGNAHHLWALIGVDASRLFEAYVGSTTGIDLYLIGYFDSQAVFFTNRVDKSTGTTGSWVDVDISGDTGGDTAIAACWEISQAGSGNWGVRKNGSSDSRVQDDVAQHVWGIIGVDGSEIFEQQVAATTVDLFLIGYLTGGATLNTNATDRSLSGTGTWTDLTALPAGAVGGIYEIGTGTDTGGLRKNGSSEALLFEVKHCWAFPECDASRLVEGQIADTGIDFFEVGFFAAPTVSNLTLSSTDTVTLTESVIQNLVLLPRPTDSVTLTESVTLQVGPQPRLTDSVTGTETVTLQLPLPAQATETVTGSETVLLGLHALFLGAVADTLTVSEGISPNLVLLPAVADAAGVADTCTVMLAVLPQPSEEVTLSETVQASLWLPAAVVDTLSLTETSALVLHALHLACSDTVTVSEISPLLLNPWLIAITEAVSVAEVATVSGPFYVAGAAQGKHPDIRTLRYGVRT